MRKRFIISATLALLSALSIPALSAEMEKDGMMKKEGMVKKEAPMKGDGMSKDDGMMKKTGMTKKDGAMKADGMMKKGMDDGKDMKSEKMDKESK